ncbi:MULTISPECIES: sensor histidine kinase [Bacteria]|uniref:sensor histidine kinase n=1 Tax=Bacteria TaxID=2 RepID=UPI003C7C698F
MPGSDRTRLRLATRALLLQLGTVVLVVALCTGAHLLLAVQQLREEAESSALGIARTLAEDPQVRTAVAIASADPGTPRADGLRDGELQRIALAVAGRTGALFVVITDDHGIRLAHPDPARLGEEVSTPYQEALAGREVVEWNDGTLGESARAKVPVRDEEGTPVGEVSVGFARAGVFDNLPSLLLTAGLAAAGALILGALASLLLRRRWERLTLGVQPEELVALVQNQTAVLNGVGEGVLAIDQAGIVRVCNDAAERLLGLRSPVGRPLASLGLPAAVHDAAAGAEPRAGVRVGDRVLYLDSRPVERDGRDLGTVVIVRDRTDLVALSERLETVRTMTAALRVQRHEFANRMHVAAGLIDAARVPEARAFLDEMVERGAVAFRIPGIDRVSDPFLHSFLGAKGIEAGERGVALRIGEESQILGTVREAEDVAAVLGNLVDNAVGAAVAGSAPSWAEVTVLDDDDALVLTVADSGPGLPRDHSADESAARADRDVVDAVHGHGLGLPLAREIARRSGGDLWIIDPGGLHGGAVFAARIGGAVAPIGPGTDPVRPDPMESP